MPVRCDAVNVSFGVRIRTEIGQSEPASNLVFAEILHDTSEELFQFAKGVGAVQAKVPIEVPYSRTRQEV
jgi:hypothetical protein